MFLDWVGWLLTPWYLRFIGAIITPEPFSGPSITLTPPGGIGMTGPLGVPRLLGGKDGNGGNTGSTAAGVSPGTTPKGNWTGALMAVLLSALTIVITGS